MARNLSLLFANAKFVTPSHPLRYVCSWCVITLLQHVRTTCRLDAHGRMHLCFANTVTSRACTATFCLGRGYPRSCRHAPIAGLLPHTQHQDCNPSTVMRWVDGLVSTSSCWGKRLPGKLCYQIVVLAKVVRGVSCLTMSGLNQKAPSS
jgi:hypothetical protein